MVLDGTDEVLEDGLPGLKGSLSSAILCRSITTECWGFTSQKMLQFLDIVTFTNKINLQGISNLHCGRSREYVLPPITTPSILPFFNKNNDKICDSCPNDIVFQNCHRISITRIQQLPFTNKMFINFCSPYIGFDRYGNHEYNCLARNSLLF